MLLHTDNLTKHYGRLVALDGLTLAVQPGEIVGLLGPNGSGKSTALRLLLGFLKPTTGQASIGGHDCWRDCVDAPPQVAYLPGELRLYENMTGRQLVRFLGQLRGSIRGRRWTRWPNGSTSTSTGPSSQLSSGMKRKVALLQVLVPRVPLLILDEPTNTLDPTMRDELLAQLRRARDRGQAVLFSSHVLTEVERICDRVAILQKGKLVHVQDMSELAPGSARPCALRRAVPTAPDLTGFACANEQKQRLILEFRGDLPLLLALAVATAVVDLQIEPLGLSEIYHHYHGNAA